MITNGRNLDLGQAASGLPDVSGAILALFQPVVVGIINNTQVNGYTQTVVTGYNHVKGVRVENNNKLVITKTGERIWISTEIYFTRDVSLKADDIFLFNKVQYRVMATEEWPEYGYNHYSVVQDFTKLYTVKPAII